jgi:sphingomyelin phosphodiesterase
MSDPTDPFGQLAWLRDQLYKAEESNTPVYLLSHIPNYLCLEEWGRVFNALVDRLSDLIRGQFYGHTHHEGFVVF